MFPRPSLRGIGPASLALHSPSLASPLHPEPPTPCFQQCTHFKAWRWRPFEKERNDGASRNTRVGNKFRENEVWAPIWLLLSPHPQRGELTYPRGHRQTGADPRPSSLASPLSSWSPPTKKTTLGIEWVKLDVIRFEGNSRFTPPPIKLKNFWRGFCKGAKRELDVW